MLSKKYWRTFHTCFIVKHKAKWPTNDFNVWEVKNQNSNNILLTKEYKIHNLKRTSKVSLFITWQCYKIWSYYYIQNALKCLPKIIKQFNLKRSKSKNIVLKNGLTDSRNNKILFFILCRTRRENKKQCIKNISSNILKN